MVNVRDYITITFTLFLFLPTLVGTGGSYFFFSVLSPCKCHIKYQFNDLDKYELEIINLIKYCNAITYQTFHSKEVSKY